jgi:RNA polymerase sigma-70 factor (ECF subfamily)
MNGMDTVMPARRTRLERSRAHHTAERLAWDWPALLAYCHAVARRQTDSPFDAEDAAQEAAARAWRHRAQCRRQPDPRAWLSCIVRREVARVCGEHRRTVESPMSELPDAGEPCPLIGQLPDRLWIHDALAALAPDDRQIVVLRYHDDLTQPRIAERLGMAEGTVKIRLHRARKSLRGRLEQEAAAG